MLKRKKKKKKKRYDCIISEEIILQFKASITK